MKIYIYDDHTEVPDDITVDDIKTALSVLAQLRAYHAEHASTDQDDIADGVMYDGSGADHAAFLYDLLAEVAG